jgi:hypothetical protein
MLKMSEVQELLKAYEEFIQLPWNDYLSGQEKVWFIVYGPSQERRVRLRIPEFAVVTTRAGYKWRLLDITDSFAEWMVQVDYRDAYFENPADMDPMLQDYTEQVISRVISELNAPDVDENTVVAISGIASLFGLTHASYVIDQVTSHIKGRLAVFFPGSYDGSMYRLLDARDGWNYLAIPITADKGN